LEKQKKTDVDERLIVQGGERAAGEEDRALKGRGVTPTDRSLMEKGVGVREGGGQMPNEDFRESW